jgi:hypothetical protein
VHANQPAPEQPPHSNLDGAFGKAGRIGNRLMTEASALFPAANRFAPQMQVYEEGGGRAIVAHKIAHQYFQHIVVNINCHYSRNHYSIKNEIVKPKEVA